MSTPGSIVKEIHRLRRHLEELQTKIDQGPKTLKSQKNKVAVQEENLRKAQDEIKNLKLQIGEKELNIKTSVGQIKKYEKQRSDVANKKEYDALEAEIKNTQAHIQKLEDEIFEAMTQVEEKTGRLPEVEKQTKKVHDEFAQFEKDHQERMDRFKAEIQKTREELEKVEETLPADLLPQFKRLIQAKGVDGLASVEGRTCTACYSEVTAQMVAELQRGYVLICKSCWRMLYLNA